MYDIKHKKKNYVFKIPFRETFAVARQNAYKIWFYREVLFAVVLFNYL